MKQIFLSAISLVLVVILCGCATFMKVEKVSSNRESTYYTNMLDFSELSINSRNYLNRNLQMDLYKSNPQELIEKLLIRFENTSDREVLEVIIDICYQAGKNADNDDEGIKYFTTAAYYSYFYLFEKNIFPQDYNEFSQSSFLLSRYYNFAVMNIFQYLRSKKMLTHNSFELPMVAGKKMFFNAPEYSDNFSDDEIDEMLLCADYEVQNALNYSHNIGIGTTLIVSSHFDRHTDFIKPIATKIFPATVFLRMTPYRNRINATLEFYDTLKEDTISINDRTVPLELDYTTPLAYGTQPLGLFQTIAITLNPNQMKNLQGLYLLTPYHPDKIPVVLVHGLLSEPRTWTQMINTLLGDKRIRDNYQFWFFAYSTGNPVIYSAKDLRDALDLCQKNFDPEGKNKSFNNMVIIGHSMGGLLSKTLIQDSHDEIIYDIFEKDKISIYDQLSAEEKIYLNHILLFQARPYIRRVIFMAVPHQGSVMAKWMIARWASRMVELPNDLISNVSNFAQELLKREQLEQNQNAPDTIILPTGFDNLDPDNKTLQCLNRIPFNKVPYHSIIGNEDGKDVPGGSDGIVDYSSSHLDDAQSELIVHSGHSVQQTAPAIQEVRRILLLHLLECGRIKISTPVKINEAVNE